MSDEQPTVIGSGGEGGTEDRPTPKTIPADPPHFPKEGSLRDLGAWTPAPPLPPQEVSPFRSTSGPDYAPESDGKTMLMHVEPERIPLAWLAIVEGPGGKRGATFTLKSETLVGRTYGDVLLGGDRTVSSQHVKIRLEPREGGGEGQEVFVLYDLASANGTYVGTRQTYRDDSSRVYRHELQDGDYVLVGETTLVFKEVREE